MKNELLPKIYTLEELLKDNSIPPEPIVDDGILLEKSILLISGKPKQGKSMLAYDFALSISSGKNFAGFKIKQAKKVLILSAEGGFYPNRERLKVKCKSKNIDNPLMSVTFNPKLLFDEDSGYLMLKRIIETNTPDVLIIDPLVRFHRQDENNATGIAKIFGSFREVIEEYNLSIILVHHLGKNESNGPRGSSAILGEYDSHICMTGSIKTQIKLEFDMRHVETPPARFIKFNKDTLWFESPEEMLTTKFKKILQEEGPLTIDVLTKLAAQNHIYSDKSNAKKGIQRDLKRGALQEENGLIMLL